MYENSATSRRRGRQSRRRGSKSSLGRGRSLHDATTDPDLSWFFRLGEHPSFDDPALRRRWLRIARGLDGSGYHLMLHYARHKACDRGLLDREYRQYRRNRDPPSSEPYIVASADALLAIMNGRKSRSRVEKYQDGAGSSQFASRPNRAVFLDTGDVNAFTDRRSTWGGVRVDADFARTCLELGFGVSHLEARALLDIEVLDMLQHETSKLQVAGIGYKLTNLVDDNPNHTGLLATSQMEREVCRETHQERRRQAEATWRAHVDSELGGKDWLHEWRFAGGIRKSWWASRKALLDVGGGVTTTTRLACVLRPLRTPQIRECLVKLACPNARHRRGFLPLDWLGSDRGHDFWMWASRECVARSGQRARSRFSALGATR